MIDHGCSGTETGRIGSDACPPRFFMPIGKPQPLFVGIVKDKQKQI